MYNPVPDSTINTNQAGRKVLPIDESSNNPVPIRKSKRLTTIIDEEPEYTIDDLAEYEDLLEQKEI